MTAKVSGVDGAAMVNVESKCLFDIGASDPGEFESAYGNIMLA